jgi:hypothetical protein
MDRTALGYDGTHAQEEHPVRSEADLVRIQAPVVLRHETEYFNYCIEKSRLKVETHELSEDLTKAQTASAC